MLSHPGQNFLTVGSTQVDSTCFHLVERNELAHGEYKGSIDINTWEIILSYPGQNFLLVG